jgi:hypothetical protein
VKVGGKGEKVRKKRKDGELGTVGPLNVKYHRGHAREVPLAVRHAGTVQAKISAAGSPERRPRSLINPEPPTGWACDMRTPGPTDTAGNRIGLCKEPNVE